MIQVKTDAEMIPVRREHVLALMDFFYRKVFPVDGEPFLNVLRQAYQAHEAAKADQVRLEEGRAKHAALTRAASVAGASGEEPKG